MKPSLALLLAVAMGAGIAVWTCGRSTTAGPHSSALTVEGSIEAGSVQNGGNCFVVDTRITNRGRADEDIVVWSNYAWSWVSDRSEITFNLGAKRNVPSHVFLKPDETYSAKLEACCPLPHEKAIQFHLGFVPRADLPASGQRDLTKWGGVFWSNVLTR